MSVAKVFMSGNSQAVRIPKEFRFDVPEIEIFRRGIEVVLRKPRRDAGRLFELLITALSDDFMADGREQPPLERREEL